MVDESCETEIKERERGQVVSFPLFVAPTSSGIMLYRHIWSKGQMNFVTCVSVFEFLLTKKAAAEKDANKHQGRTLPRPVVTYN